MRRLITLLWTLVTVLAVSAQIRGNSIAVSVVPDHQDWKYDVGETATFKVSVTRSNTLIDNVTAQGWYINAQGQDDKARFLSGGRDGPR